MTGMNRKRNRLTVAGFFLLTAALCMMIWNLAEEQRAEDSAEVLVQGIEKWILQNRYVQPAKIKRSVLEKGETEETEEQIPVLEVNGNQCVGIVEIPSLELKLPVMDQWSYSNLKLSPCRFSGSVYLDNMIIIAHNYKKHFGQLKSLKPGEKVQFTDVNGSVFAYMVTQLQELGSMDIDLLNEGQWDLTLLTCTLDGDRRVTVRCKRIEDLLN